MRKYFSMMLVLASMMFVFGSCSKEEEIPVLKTDYEGNSIYFSALALETENVTINVETNQSTWDVTSNQSWCVITKLSNSFIVSAKPASSHIVTQPATICITAGNATPIYFEARQEALFLSCQPSTELFFTDDGGHEVLTILCNSIWTVSVDKEWVSVSKNSGTGNDEIEVTVMPSNENVITEATLSVQCGDVLRVIKIKRDQKRKIYALGDYYPDEQNPIGVVFAVENNGKNGLVVNLNEIYGYYSYEYYSLGANSITDGRYNMKKMSERGIYLYPAAQYCQELGSEWYIPARNEAYAIYDNVDLINEKITIVNGDMIHSTMMSSTESNSIYFMLIHKDGSFANMDKRTTSATVRPILSF